jgi:chemotaxis signal transduction protein
MLSLDRNSRYILTKVREFTLVFPAGWVKEILRVDRSLILDLPFYNSYGGGLIHHRGQVLPLVHTHLLLECQTEDMREDDSLSTIVSLNGSAGNLAGLGAIIDRALGSQSHAELNPQLFIDGTHEHTILARPQLLATKEWQPQY